MTVNTGRNCVFCDIIAGSAPASVLRRWPDVIAIQPRHPVPPGKSVFLAGPTPRASEVPSWRPAAIELIEAAWIDPEPLTVLTPESRGGVRANEYDDQVEWEAAGLDSASAIMFWIPRDLW